MRRRNRLQQNRSRYSRSVTARFRSKASRVLSSDDGRYLVYALDAGPNPTPAQDLYVLPLFGDRKPFPIVRSPFQENEAHEPADVLHHDITVSVLEGTERQPKSIGRPEFSFDGKWLAYASNESGRFQVYIVSFPALDQKRQVSTNGGSQPQWRRDGKELYYLAPEGKLMAVDITSSARIDSGPPRELFDTELTLSPLQDQYRVTPDGQRFLVLKPTSEATPMQITVIVNWTARLQQ
jgi:eukaryotic-like serine/threonine-protein kinase